MKKEILEKTQVSIILFEQQTKDDNLSEIHDIANSVSELHSETKAVEHRFNLLSVSNFESEMSDMKQLQEMMSQLATAINQLVISQNRNLVLEREANDANVLLKWNNVRFN